MPQGLLASAQGGDASVSNLTLALMCLGIVVAVGVAALVPLVVAASRGHRRSEALLGFTILWAFLSAGSLIYATMAQTKWAAERDLRIKSGYYDPNDTSDAPPLPIGQWTALGIGYVGLLTWAALRPRTRLPATPVSPAKMRG